ncbi:hypothetical protein HDU78_001323 [Chytriomyces hyalinus]|nr:hypothetical protein HDU78_001323 [Chytriomyces hyalinus]
METTTVPPDAATQLDQLLTLEDCDGNSCLRHYAASLGRIVARLKTLTQAANQIQRQVGADASCVTMVESLVEAVTLFVAKLGNSKFMHTLVNRDAVADRIAAFNQEISAAASTIAVQIELDSKNWADEDREDRRLDKEELDLTLQHLVDNDYKILNALELKQNEYMEAMEALQKNLADHVDKALERNLDRIFMERALNCLRRASEATVPGVSANSKQASPPEWVLTSWEIDIGDTVAQGGFAEVLKATWLNHTTVAVKRLHMRLETKRMREDFMREVKTWFPLRHPNILPLLGACATADRPFMVSPFMKRGHSLQYLDWCSDRFGNECIESRGVKLLYEVSLGMQYLHSRGVVHGDLKAVNVLVDEYGNANVADFGFASLKQFSSTRMTTSAKGAANFGGTLRWMSPERLQGERLTPPVDVYAFAMTCYELLTGGDVPLSDIPDPLLYQHIVHNNRRPILPIENAPASYPNTCKQIQRLMKVSWDPNPLARPSFGSIAITMKSVVCDVVAPGKGKAVVDAIVPSVLESQSGGTYRNSQAVESLAIEAFGGDAIKNPAFGNTKLAEPTEFNDVIHFEPGTWGSLVNDLLPVFPAHQQKEIKTGIFMFGKQLCDSINEISGSGEFQTFLYNVKMAAAMETSSVRFMEFMQRPSVDLGEQRIKMQLHLALTKLGSKTRLLHPPPQHLHQFTTQNQQQRNSLSRIFETIYESLQQLYHSPISLVTANGLGVSVGTSVSEFHLNRNSDNTLVYERDSGSCADGCGGSDLASRVGGSSHTSARKHISHVEQTRIVHGLRGPSA